MRSSHSFGDRFRYFRKENGTTKMKEGIPGEEIDVDINAVLESQQARIFPLQQCYEYSTTIKVVSVEIGSSSRERRIIY